MKTREQVEDPERKRGAEDPERKRGVEDPERKRGAEDPERKRGVEDPEGKRGVEDLGDLEDLEDPAAGGARDPAGSAALGRMGACWLFFCSFLLLLLTLFLLPGCGTNPRVPADRSRGSHAGQGIVIWAGIGPAELAALEEVATEFSKISSVPVHVVQVPYTDLQMKFQLAAPALVGPDLLLGPHDWVGPLSLAGMIVPVDRLFSGQEIKSFLPLSLTSFSSSGSLYGVPLFIETLALIYNPGLVPRRPATFEEVLLLSKKARKERRYGLVWGLTDFYFAWPFFSAFGARIFRDAPGGLSGSGQSDHQQPAGAGQPPGPRGSLPPHLALDSPEGIQAAHFLQDLVHKEHLFSSGMSKEIANGLFLEQKASMIINGPWFLGDLEKGKVPFKVIPIPPLGGKAPTPFLGVLGAMINSKSLHPAEAREFIIYLARRENMRKVYQASGRLPARKDLLNEVEKEERVRGFVEACYHADLMPNIPPMTQVWPFMEQALTLMIKGPELPEKALPVFMDQARKSIQLMMQ